jgi:predicted MFS family arabinose efflux permease
VGEEDSDGPVSRAVARRGVEPDPSQVLHSDPSRRSLWWALGYVLRVRTNVVLVVASALGYSFFEGLRSFALVFTTAHYGIPSSVAVALVLVVGVGAIVGVVVGGRLTDRLLGRGRVSARIVVPTVCLLVMPAVFAPAVITTAIGIALPLLVAATALLGAVNPPLDAARLDIMSPRLWGRAEAVRSLLRRGGEAAAPAVFGLFSDRVFTGPNGLELTFLTFLALLLAAGLLGLVALRTYPRDVATAAASARAIG